MRVILIVLVLLFWGSINSQTKDPVIPDSLQRHYYSVLFPKIALNKRFVAFNKAYDKKSDTVVVIDRDNKQRVIFERGDVLANSVIFTSNNNLMMRQGRNFQLLFLPSLKLKVWEDTKDFIWIPEHRLILVLQAKKLIILNQDGEEKQVIDDVENIKKIEGTIYFTAENQEKTYCLYEWNIKQNKKLFSSKSSVMDVKYRDNNGLFILVRSDGTKPPQLVYKSNKSDEYYFSDGFKEAINLIEISKLDDEKYFVHFFTDTKPKNKDEVELWYGNDRKIQKKIYEGSVGKYYLWSPTKGLFFEILNNELTHQSFIGNDRYLLSFDPYYKHDYTKRFPTFNLHRYDTVLNQYDFIIDSGSMVFTDTKGKWILTHRGNGNWILYEVDTLKSFDIPLNEYENAYFSNDGKTILFEGMGKLFQYDLSKKNLQEFPLKSGFRAKIKSGKMEGAASSYNIFSSFYDSSTPVIIELYDRENIKNAWVSFNGKSVKDIINITDDDVTSVEWSTEGKNFFYIKSNINKPPELLFNESGKEDIIYKSNSHDQEAKKIFSKVVQYKNSHGESLQGLLLYPINFKKEIKYPMIVTTYQKLRYMKNKYLIDGIGNNYPTEGINIRNLLRKGYLVFMPDIVFDSRGTGRSALDCVTAAMSALLDNQFIDFTKVALVGHSHGGYETNFIATQSDLFATYVSGAGNSDLVRSYHSFNYNFIRPFYWQFEDGQYEMPGSFAEHKSLYIDNSPIYHAEKVQRPILLWTGKKDYNIFWEQTMEFYLGLRRNHKQVVAVFYPDDEHSLSKIKNRIDLYTRITDWLDFHLKNRNVEWIEEMNK